MSKGLYWCFCMFFECRKMPIFHKYFILYRHKYRKSEYRDIYKVIHNYGNTQFMIVLDEKQSNLKICWIC